MPENMKRNETLAAELALFLIDWKLTLHSLAGNANPTTNVSLKIAEAMGRLRGMWFKEHMPKASMTQQGLVYEQAKKLGGRV